MGAAALAQIFASAAVLDAAFLDSGWGVRPLGMGGAFTAVANDASGTTFNPAGIAQLSQHEFTFVSSRLFTGLEGVDVGQNYFSYALPGREGTGNFGLTWTSLSSPGLYREDAGGLSYGRSLDDVLRARGVSFYAGASLRYLRHEFTLDALTADDAVFANGNSAGAFTGDIGVLATLPKTGLSFALASKNITSPNIGLKNQDLVPNENVLGLAYYNENAPLPYFTAAVDVVSRDDEMDYRLGVETWLIDGAFALRAGGRPQELAFGLGYEVRLGETKLILDYAFAWPLEVEQTSGSHRLGLTLRLP